MPQQYHQITAVGTDGLPLGIGDGFGQIIAIFIGFEQHIFTKCIARKWQHLHAAIARHLVALTPLQTGDGGIDLALIGQSVRILGEERKAAMASARCCAKVCKTNCNCKRGFITELAGWLLG